MTRHFILLAFSFSLSVCFADSPFSVQVKTAPQEGADCASVSVSVPPKHVVYASSFKVESGGHPAVSVRAATPRANRIP